MVFRFYLILIPTLSLIMVKCGQDGAKMAPRWATMVPRWVQDGTKMVSSWGLQTKAAEMTPEAPQDGPRWPKDGPKRGLGGSTEDPQTLIFFRFL